MQTRQSPLMLWQTHSMHYIAALFVPFAVFCLVLAAFGLVFLSVPLILGRRASGVTQFGHSWHALWTAWLRKPLWASWASHNRLWLMLEEPFCKES